MSGFDLIMRVGEVIVLPCIAFVLNMHARLTRVETKIDMMLSHVVKEKETE